jgi:hypothetical protein
MLYVLLIQQLVSHGGLPLRGSSALSLGLGSGGRSARHSVWLAIAPERLPDVRDLSGRPHYRRQPDRHDGTGLVQRRILPDPGSSSVLASTLNNSFCHSFPVFKMTTRFGRLYPVVMQGVLLFSVLLLGLIVFRTCGVHGYVRNQV